MKISPMGAQDVCGASTQTPGVKNIASAIFFIPDVCAVGRPKHPVILHRFRLRENASECRSYERHGRKD